MKAGDLVKADNWVWDGKAGIVVKVQPVKHCRGVYVLFDIGIKLIRVENLQVISDGQ